MYCDCCGRHTSGINIEAKRMVAVHKTSFSISYEAKTCEHCGSELYIEATESYLLQEASARFKKQQKLLLSSEISSYIQKTGMSPDELAAAVKCSVGEIIGATHGAIQSAETDVKLKAIIHKKRTA